MNRRIRALQLLRHSTGKNFGLNAFESPKSQLEKQKKWSNWLAANEKIVVNRKPLRLESISLLPLAEDIGHGLIAHYTLNEIRAGNLKDHSGNERSGTLHGKHAIAEGVTGKAIRFEGNGDSGSRGGHASIPFIDFNKIDSFTVALWVKHEGSSSEHGEAFICYGFDQGTSFDGSLCIGAFFGNIQFRTGAGIVYIAQPPEDRDRWVHYAMTFDGENVRVFKDGAKAGEQKLQVEVKGTLAGLGRHWWNNGSMTSTRFIGSLDDVRIYDRALDAKQIKRLQDLK